MSTRRRKSHGSLEALYWLAIGLAIAALVAFIGPKLGISLPLKLFLVQSGSMEPSIMTGDLILTLPERSYRERDVITFRSPQDERVITHRISEVRSSGADQLYITKGDANPEIDTQEVSRDLVIGRVVLTLPKLGFLVAFARSRVGLFICILVPAILILYDEYRSVAAQT